MRVTPNRVVKTLGFLTVFYLILKFFPGLPFLNFQSLGLRSGASVIVDSLRSLVGLSRRGVWLKKLDTSDADFRHLEHYCEGPPLKGVRSKKETLLAAQMLIRHGDRGALFTVKDESQTECPFDESHALPDTFLSYHEAAVAVSKPKIFDFVPGKEGCLNGELTSKGVIQHLELGAAMRKRLEENAQKWNVDKAAVYSTHYPRTYQSAMAFMHGLSPSLESLPRNIHISPAGDHYFCTLAKSCCPSRNNVSNEYFRVKRRLVEETPDTVALTARLRDLLSSHLTTPLDNWPTYVFDVLLQFACHGRRVPCYDGTCITFHELVQVITHLEDVADRLSVHPTVRQYSVVNVYGLLKTVGENLMGVANGNLRAPEARFSLFSAHDATVVPVMHVLGLPFRIVIPYASFVLFELYTLEKEGEGGVAYVRVIYNGDDVTGKTIPASRLGSLGTPGSPLPLRVFKEFIDVDVKREYVAACAASE